MPQEILISSIEREPINHTNRVAEAEEPKLMSCGEEL